MLLTDAARADSVRTGGDAMSRISPSTTRGVEDEDGVGREGGGRGKDVETSSPDTADDNWVSKFVRVELASETKDERS